MEFNHFKKIPWIYEMPEVFSNGVLFTKRLDELSEDAQKELVYMVVSTLGEYFGQIPVHYVEISKEEPLYSDKFTKSLSNMLPTWLSGLCDVSVAQIIYALLDILNLRTEYQKWPPKSVMEFHAVCKISRPAYHDVPKAPTNVLRIEYDKESARAKTEEIAAKCLKEIFQKLGRNYEKVREQKIANGIYGVQFKVGNGRLQEV